MQLRCPGCGYALAELGENTVKRFDSGWQREEMQDFGYSVPAVAGAESAPAPMPGAIYTKQQPARPASVPSDVLTPFWQAVISGAMIAFVSILVTVGGFLLDAWPWWVIPIVFFCAFVIVSGFWWFKLLGAHRKLLWLVEMITGKDLDQDGQKGPPRQAEPFCVEWTDRENKRKEKHYWPVPEAQIREIGQAHLRGVNLSKRELAKHTSLSEEKALEVLAYMRQKAYAQYVDGNRTELTGRGEWFFKQLLSS
jgi:hypothetical protein